MAIDDIVEFWDVGSEYREFRDRQGIPVHTGYYVQDVRECAVGRWERTGVNGAFVNLVGNEGLNDVQIIEIPPGEEMKPQQHFHEQICYVVGGHGATAIGPEDDEQTFEWNQNALFAVPRNARYVHVNLSDDEPVRLVVETDLPLQFSLVGEEEFIFGDVGHSFADVTDSVYYSTEGTMYEGAKFPVVWQSNFIPDIHTYDEIEHWHARGAGGASIRFSHPDTSLWTHISQFPVGTYKKGHRHNAGANVIILEGEGYSLMWTDETADDKMKIEWQPGSLFPPPTLWYHQHFNTGTEPARYMALHPSNIHYTEENNVFDPVRESNQIQYPDEDPEIRERFERELGRRGLESRMPEEAYEDPDYDFNQNYTEMTGPGD